MQAFSSGAREPESRFVVAAMLDFAVFCFSVVLSTLPNLPLLLTSKMADMVLNQNHIATEADKSAQFSG